MIHQVKDVIVLNTCLLISTANILPIVQYLSASIGLIVGVRALIIGVRQEGSLLGYLKSFISKNG